MRDRPSPERMGAASFAVSVTLLLAACSGDVTPTPMPAGLDLDLPASLAELTGPWRAEPLILDDAIVAKVDAVCRADVDFPAGLPLVAIDARGAGKMLVSYAGPNALADCDDVEVDENGQVTGSLSSHGNNPTTPPAPGRILVVGFGGGPEIADAASTFVRGRVGPGISIVVIDVPTLGRVRATVRGGWFVAWWPTECCGFTVSAYDPFGMLLDQVTPE